MISVNFIVNNINTNKLALLFWWTTKKWYVDVFSKSCFPDDICYRPILWKVAGCKQCYTSKKIFFACDVQYLTTIVYDDTEMCVLHVFILSEIQLYPVLCFLLLLWSLEISFQQWKWFFVWIKGNPRFLCPFRSHKRAFCFVIIRFEINVWNIT